MQKHGIDPLHAGHKIMEHEVKSVIGEGGFGIVYLAEHPKLHLRAAVKEFAPSNLAHRDETGALVPNEGKEALYAQILERFDKTAAQLCALDHPNIVRVFNQRSDNNTSYVLMEYVTGQTFGDWVHDTIGTLDENRLKTVLLPLLDAIEYLHGRHLLHRDIAPDNILMRQDGMPILIDFGTLKQHVLGEETSLEAPDDYTKSVIVAKKFFSPPEQFSAYRKAEVGATADIYSLGATIYDALAGRADDMTRHLVPATERASSFVTVGGREMPPLHEVTRVPMPRAFCDAVDAALSLSPRDRPQSVAAFRKMLFGGDAAARPAAQAAAAVETGIQNDTPQTPLPNPGAQHAPDGQEGVRWGRLAGLGGVAALAIAGGVYFFVPAGEMPVEPASGEPALDDDVTRLADGSQTPDTTQAPPVTQGQTQTQSPPQTPAATTTTTIASAPTTPTSPPTGGFTVPEIATGTTPVIGGGSEPITATGTLPSPPSDMDDDPPPAIDTTQAPPPPAPEFRLDLARNGADITAQGTVPPALRAALEDIFGSDDIGPGLQAADNVTVPDGPSLGELARIIEGWPSFSLSADADGARLQGVPSNAQTYIRAVELAGDSIAVDASFLTRSLPQRDVLALIDFHDPCGTIVPIDLGDQLTPSDHLSLFGLVESEEAGRDLQRQMTLLLPGTLDGNGLFPTTAEMCAVARSFGDFTLGSPKLVDSFMITSEGDRAPLGQPVAHDVAPQFAVPRGPLPETGFLWSGLVIRGPGRDLLMLPLSQPSGDVEDLGILSRDPGDPTYVALSVISDDIAESVDRAFAPELALTFDAEDEYAMLLGLVLDRAISGLPSLGATTAPDADAYIDRLEQAVEAAGANILFHFQHAIDVN